MSCRIRKTKMGQREGGERGSASKFACLRRRFGGRGLTTESKSVQKSYELAAETLWRSKTLASTNPETRTALAAAMACQGSMGG